MPSKFELRNNYNLSGGQACLPSIQRKTLPLPTRHKKQVAQSGPHKARFLDWFHTTSSTLLARKSPWRFAPVSQSYVFSYTMDFLGWCWYGSIEPRVATGRKLVVDWNECKGQAIILKSKFHRKGIKNPSGTLRELSKPYFAEGESIHRLRESQLDRKYEINQWGNIATGFLLARRNRHDRCISR